MYMERNLPVYEIVINDGDITGTEFVSLVKEPAIEVGFHAFAVNTNKYSFKTVGDQQKLMGPVAIPDIKIYRNDEEMGEYYVVFTKETIAKMAEKFNRNALAQNVNLDHQPDSKIPGAFVSENWIIEGEFDKSKNYGFELPEGTWMATVKIDDKALWDDTIKTGKVMGFSLEGMLGLEKIKSNKQEKMEKTMKFDEELILKDGTKLVAKDWNVGTEVFVETPDGQVPAEDKVYEAEDGTLVATEGGKVKEVTYKDEVAEPTADYAKYDASIADLTDRLAKVEAALTEMLDANGKMATENAALSAKVEELSKAPAAISLTKTVVAKKNIIERAEKEKIEDTVARLKNFAKLSK